ncbi:hypothetical protein M6B22_19525 [Jatrophihabitans cynanchi]|uniref:Uncharacterized protein n=1 Tax=Jatrophihabitans cynanchi TaxID=2944128 RepID=A0ABY7JVW7_9ACTN|nr:hypothetical protein [Jatrophihabitans sp. SB3-54]WAX56697.1 hypothetical protein M6B22_19525 [Jatrophihabitans sp. SB3-54]
MAAALGWVEVEDEVGGDVGVRNPEQGRMEFDGTLIGEPQQGPAVVAQRVGDLPLRGRGPHRCGGDPVRRVLRHVLLHERLLTAQRADDRQRPVAEGLDDLRVKRVEVVDEVALGGLGTVEQRLVQVGERDAVAGFTRSHGTIFSRRADSPSVSGQTESSSVRPRAKECFG